METNLTIKHLSAYLPYGLKAIDSDGNIDIVTCIDIEEIDGYNIKPILRPLSDLQKLIVEEFDKYDGIRDGKANYQIIDLFCEENGCYGDVVNIDLTKLPYECAIYIFENHYDFFGLIDKGLAIDINTL